MNQLRERNVPPNRKFFKSAKILEKAPSEHFFEFQREFLEAKRSLSEMAQEESVEKKEEPRNQTQKTLTSRKNNEINSSLRMKTNNVPSPLKTSQILAKKFVSLLKKNANLNTFLPKRVAHLIQDQSYFRKSEGNRSRKGKFLATVFWLKSRILGFVLDRKLTELLENMNRTFTINPFAKTKVFWDIFVFVNTLMMFFYLPLTLSFNLLSDDTRNFLHDVEFGIYVLDMIINFNTGYVDHGVVVKSRALLLKYYLKGVFAFDFLALFSLVAKNEDFLDHEAHESSNFFIFFQLLFFLLFPSVKAKYQRIKEFFCLDTKLKGILELIVLLTTSLFFCHCFACFFHMIAALNTTNPETWLTRYGLKFQPVVKQYLYSLYWSTVTIMTVGYGDITPQNPREITFTLLTIVCGCVVFGYNLNKIASIFQEMNEDKKKMQGDILKINRFMESKSIDSTLQMRIRAYLKFVWENHDEKLNEEVLGIIDLLSDSLKNELYLNSYGRIMRNHSFFQSGAFSEDFLGAMMRCTEEENFMKNDMIYSQDENKDQSLYYIHSGSVELYKPLHSRITSLSTVNERSFFGEYSFITGLHEFHSARATEFTKIYKISHQKLIDTLRSYPLDYEKYCEIRDQFVLYQDFANSELRCLVCLRKDHLSNGCCQVHYIPNKSMIVLRHAFSRDMNRRIELRRAKKHNSLRILSEINATVRKFSRCMKCDSEEMSDSVNSFKIETLSDVRSGSQTDFVELTNQNPAENTAKSFHLQLFAAGSRPKNSSENELQTLIKPSKVDFEQPNNSANHKEISNFSSIYRNSEQDIDGVKVFSNYFPDSNVSCFLEKYKGKIKLIMKVLRKRKKNDTERSKSKSGYGIFLSLRINEKSLNSHKEEPNKHSLGNSSSMGFFSSGQMPKRLTLMDLVLEAKKKLEREQRPSERNKKGTFCRLRIKRKAERRKKPQD